MKTSIVLQAMAFGFLIAFVVSALAGEATLEAENNGERASVQIEYRDGGLVRMSVPQQPEGYLLVKDRVAYSVSQQDGQAMVMRLDALRGMAQGMPVPSPTGDLASVGDMVPTGRHETVAGVSGEVWSLTYTDDQGQAQQAEVVVSEDPRAVAMTRAMNALAEAMASALGQSPNTTETAAQGRLSGKGILRWGHSMRVTELNAAQTPISRFTLPAQPMAMPSSGGFGDQLGKLFGEKAERQENRVGDRVEREADNSLDEKVKGFLDSVF